MANAPSPFAQVLLAIPSASNLKGQTIRLLMLVADAQYQLLTNQVWTQQTAVDEALKRLGEFDGPDTFIMQDLRLHLDSLRAKQARQ